MLSERVLKGETEARGSQAEFSDLAFTDQKGQINGFLDFDVNFFPQGLIILHFHQQYMRNSESVKVLSLSHIWLMHCRRPGASVHAVLQNGLPFPSPRDPSNPGIKPRSPALQADSLPCKPPGKPHDYLKTSAAPCMPNFSLFCPYGNCEILSYYHFNLNLFYHYKVEHLFICLAIFIFFVCGC